MPKKLPENVTLDDLLSILADAGDYARGIYLNMADAEEAHCPVAVRLGITGTGRNPSYRLESASGQPLAAFNGDYHDPFTGVGIASPTNWSKASMSKDEVKAFWEKVYNSKHKG